MVYSSALQKSDVRSTGRKRGKCTKHDAFLSDFQQLLCVVHFTLVSQMMKQSRSQDNAKHVSGRKTVSVKSRG